MKEFRIAKCLDNDGNGIHEYAIFADGSRKKIIQNDKQYGKYFEVDNELNDEYKNFLRFSFSGRIKDAVDMIRNGNGDCIQSVKLFGRVDKVIYFLDRKVGEELRQKSLDGWKDTKFGWAIECGYKNSFSGYSMINKKTERISVFDEERKPMTFETKEEADKNVESLIERARYYAKQLANKISGVDDEEERGKIIDTIIDEIEENTNTKFSIIQDFAFDMLTGDCQLKNSECNLDEMGYKIVQCIVS